MQYNVQDEPFALGYLACDSDELALKISSGMLRQAQEMPLQIHPEWKLAGLGTPDQESIGQQIISYRYGRGITVLPNRLQEKLERYPEKAAEYQAIFDAFGGKGTQERVEDARTPEEKILWENNTLWGGRWGGHCNIDFGGFVHSGTSGIRAKIAQYRPLHPEKDEWYAALDQAMEAVEILAQRFRLLAQEEEKHAPQEKKYIYARIAKALETVPCFPAYDFFSAVQSFYLLYSFDGVDSPGYFDQYMGEYYDQADPQEAREILEGLWTAFHDIRAWNLCIGGSTADGQDRTNALSYTILDVTRDMGFQTPNLTLRWHRNMDDKFLRKAIETIGTGIGLPALYNDESVCPALEALGIPPEDAHEYAMNGCNQIDIQGKSHMGLEDGELSVLKCLEYALFNGVDLLNGRQASIQTGDAAAFETYDQLWDAFKRQVAFATEQIVVLSNRSQQIFAQTAPNPLRSAVLQGCIEKGRDYSAGGAIYNHGQLLTEGLADAADSLAAIRHFVFETEKWTMAQLLDMLRADFAGYEAERLILRGYDKFGNDVDEVDQIAADIQKFYFTEMRKYRTWRDPVNGIYGGGLSTFSRTGRYGGSAGASANGRHSRDVLIADSIGATPGCDRLGPTAALCSAMKYDHSLATSGFVMQLKFDRKLFNTPEGLENFLRLVKGYFMGGGQQLSINVVDKAELLDAVEHPEKHENLIVRVGGYSDYFTRLSPALQQNIIARTSQSM